MEEVDAMGHALDYLVGVVRDSPVFKCRDLFSCLARYDGFLGVHEVDDSRYNGIIIRGLCEKRFRIRDGVVSLL
jgi:hypothetical protein